MKPERQGPVPAEALAYLRSKKLTPSFDHRDIWREAHATAFTVAKAMQLDVVESVRDALDQALAEEHTFEQFRKDLTPTLQRLGWWGEKDETDPVTGDIRTVQLGSPRRLKTIYDTNMTIAYQAGQWQRIQRSKKSFPYLKYVLGPSKEHRPEHAAWAGTVLSVDDPWWSTHRPKNGWGCNCDVISLTEAQARREGISEPPPVTARKWKNDRTGEVMDVPVGIDPGWDFNPGQVAQEEYAAQMFGSKIKAVSAEIGSLAMQSAGDYVRASMRRNFQRWVEPLLDHSREPVGEVRLVSVFPADVIYALEEKGIALLSAAITIEDRILSYRPGSGRDAALPESDVLALSARLDNPKAVLLDSVKPGLIYIFDLSDGALGEVVVRLSRGVRSGGDQKRRRTNAITALLAVQPEHFVADRYTVIKGVLSF